MATENHVAIIGKPVTCDMVDRWVSVDDMISVLAIEKITNGALCGNSIQFDEICVDIDCAAVAGIVILETKDGEQQPDLRFRQFPVTPGSWCERDGQFCIATCIDIADDCCPEPEPEEAAAEYPWCVDWCKRWRELDAKFRKYSDELTSSISSHGRSKTTQRMTDKAFECLKADLKYAENKCRACKGIRQAGRSMFKRIPRRQYKYR